MIKKAAEIAFLVLIFSLAFMQPGIDSFGPVMTLTDPIFVLTGALFLAAVVARQAAMRFDRIYIFFALYAAALALSAIFSEDQKVSFVKLVGEYYLVGLAFLTVNVVRTEAMMRRVVLVWLAASGVSAIISTLAVISFYLGISWAAVDIARHEYGLLPAGNYLRLHGTFLYPSMLCNYLTASLLMLLAARRLAYIKTAIFVFLIIVFAVAMLFTFTAGLGGAILAITIWLYFELTERGRPTISKTILTAGILAVAAFQAAAMFTFRPIPTSPYSFEIAGVRVDPSVRLLTGQGALETFLSHPIFGKGLGLGVAQTLFQEPSGQMVLLTDAHNMLLNVAAQSGIIAAIALVAICVVVVLRSLPFDLSRENALRTALSVAFVSAFIVQGMVGSFEDSRHLWVLIGLVLSSNFSWPNSPAKPAEAGTQNLKTVSP